MRRSSPSLPVRCLARSLPNVIKALICDIYSGMIVGLVIRVSPGKSIQNAVSFDYQFFFNLLLPPIILASGYELHQVCFLQQHHGG